MRQKRSCVLPGSYISIFLTLLLFLSAGVLGCSEAGGQEVVSGKLGRKVQGIVASYGQKKLQGARISLKVYSITDKEVVYELDAKTAVSIASNMKLATTAAALALLGSEHRLTATLYRRGRIESGVLKGDLVVVGLGDPNVSGRFYGGDSEAVLDSWAGALASVGINRVEGSIIADATAYGTEEVPPGWPRNQLERWYCAPVSALSINDNCFDVTFGPGAAPGNPALVALRPRAGVVKFTNQCTTTTNRKKKPILLRQPGSNDVTAKGSYWSGVKPRVYNITVHNPPLVFISALKEALKRQNIGVSGSLEVAAKPVPGTGLVPVIQHSTVLATAIAVTNKNSQNMHAEILLRELGRKSGDGTRQGGIKALKKFMGSIGVPAVQVSPADGCGLDGETKMSPNAIVSLLVHMGTRPDFHVFRESLAVSGYDGTLENRLGNKGHAGRVHAKTGYIKGVSALSGFAADASGREFAFSIIFNNAAALTNTFMKGIQDEIVGAILDNK